MQPVIINSTREMLHNQPKIVRTN